MVRIPGTPGRLRRHHNLHSAHAVDGATASLGRAGACAARGQRRRSGLPGSAAQRGRGAASLWLLYSFPAADAAVRLHQAGHAF